MEPKAVRSTERSEPTDSPTAAKRGTRPSDSINLKDYLVSLYDNQNKLIEGRHFDTPLIGSPIKRDI